MRPLKAVKLDTRLTARGRQREAAIRVALDETTGRIPKEEWARRVGTSSTAYKEAKTHMPRGMSYVIPVRSARDVQAARRSSKTYALERARNILRRKGKKKPTDEEAQAVIVQQNEQIQRLNLSLAQKRDELREYADQGKETEKDLLLRQILHKHAEINSGEKLPSAPRRLSAEERQKMAHQYYHFLNRVPR
jgi:hypothetical protein